ncbi:MAG: Uncharacterised protein [Cyanobium sp. ARS6]|nr:MAG: Uncharacterised protein [Cyanobium sp. ARS6]
MHRLHQRDGGLTHGVEKRLVDAQEASMPHHAAQQPAQDVAAAQIAGRDAIADQLRDGATVVADHLERGFALVVELVVVDTSQISCRCNQGKNQIGFVVIGNLLQDLSHALKAHAGIDVAVRQWCECALRIAIRLHEHQVVELDEAVVVFQIDPLITQFRFEVVINLRAGTTGPCWT